MTIGALSPVLRRQSEESTRSFRSEGEGDRRLAVLIEGQRRKSQV